MKKILISGIMVSFLIACSSTRITSSWKADNITARQYNKILVLGLINEPDRTVREEMEQHLVGDLKDMGYTAVCSCDEFDPKAFDKMNEKEALAKLSKSGIDAVLTVVLLDKEKERYYVPGRVSYTPYSVYHRRFWGYYSTMYSRVYSPGYYVTDTRYFWESNFYDLGNGQELLYSVQSQSFDPASAKKLGDEYGQLIVKDMVKNNVLANRNEVKLKPM
ncbi:MAG: hypothetical protein JNK14_16640 [Chitinophagaceae bacterium]|nr:hypothetical protein [Chitinophagaceae bacterium]